MGGGMGGKPLCKGYSTVTVQLLGREESSDGQWWWLNAVNALKVTHRVSLKTVKSGKFRLYIFCHGVGLGRQG